MTGPRDEAERLGRELAQLALRQGASEIIDRIDERMGPQNPAPPP